MKKTQPALRRKSRRLSLNRETIQVLNDPALLELARGGRVQHQGSAIDSCETSTVSDTGC
jgi:hypothetical protein